MGLKHSIITSFITAIFLIHGSFLASQNITLSVSDSSIPENGGTATVTATSNQANLTDDITVDLAFSGTAVLYSDYSIDNTSIIIPSGSLTGSAIITAIDDLIYENDEIIMIDIDNVTNASEAGTQQVTIEITDDEDPPEVTLSASDNSFSENGGSVNIIATLSHESSQPVTVELETEDETASEDDYSLSETQIIIAAGDIQGHITITGEDDDVAEPNETLSVEIDEVTGANATIGSPDSVELTIIDDEGLPSVSLSASADSFSENEGSVNIIATLSHEASQSVTIDLTAINGTASDDDYSLSETQITIEAGDTEEHITITGENDDIIEGDETFTVQISSVTGANATIGSPDSAELTITDDESPPVVTLSASDDSFSENGGSADIIATLSGETSQSVTVNLTAVNETASDDDYSLSATQIIIEEGDTEGQITISGVDDALAEGNETLSMEITEVDGTDATIGSPASVELTIIDDEDPLTVTLSASTASFSEDGGNTNIIATLSDEAQEAVIVNLTAVNGTASDDDYTLSATQIIIEEGNTEGQITITGVDDERAETDETLSVEIASVNLANATIGSPSLVELTIIDDEDPPLVSLSVSPTSISEAGGISTITAVLNRPTYQEVVATLNISNGSASNEDYLLASNTIIIPQGSLTGTTTLTGVDDSIYEGDETLVVSISSVSGGSASQIDNQNITLRIIDNEDPPTTSLSVSPSTIPENGSSTITATLSNATTENVLVNIETSNITTENEDYNLSSPSITIPAGSLSGTTTLDAIPDNLYEGDEALEVSISQVAGGSATISGQQSDTITIEDAQTIPSVSLQLTGSSFSEDGGSASINIILSHASTQEVQVNIEYSGTAQNSDYSGASSRVTIAAGSLQETITITGIDDQETEGDETIIATISSVTNATTNGTQEVTLTILDDDIAGIKPIVNDGSTITSESGTTDAFSIVLNTQPQSNVLVEITGLDATEGSLNINEITFTPANWDEPRTIIVTGIDDNEADGDITYTLTIAVIDAQSDPNYHGLNTTVDVTNRDNDTADFSVNITNSETVTSESGTSDVFSVVLNSQPASEVVFRITGHDDTEGTLSTDELTFTPGNWNQPQTVTITGVDDDEVDGDITYTLIVSVADELSDEAYHGQSQIIDVTNRDDDTAGLVISPEEGFLETSESGISDSFSVSITSYPESSVLIRITGLDDTEGTISTDELTFTPENWNQPQTVTITGVDDNEVDGDIEYMLTLSVNDIESDDNYAGISTSVTVINRDNDEDDPDENQAPVAVNDEFTMVQDEILEGTSLLDNDSDPDDNELIINLSPVETPQNGLVTINMDGTFEYTPNSGFTGTDSFEYEVCDNGTPSLCATAEVIITIESTPSHLEVRDGYSPSHGPFTIDWINQFDKVTLVLFNRWGNVIYQNDRYDNSWNGEATSGFNKGHGLPVGTYYYIITIADTNEQINGYFYLTR